MGPPRAAGAVPARRRPLRRSGCSAGCRRLPLCLGRDPGGAVGPGRPQCDQRRWGADGVLAGAPARRWAAALAGVRGARRRLERVGETAAGAIVYDDYAHHPTEVTATIAAVRTLRPQRLVAVFQPHLYSRTRELAQAFGAALATADAVAVLPVYPARERAEDFPGIDGRLVAAAAA